MDLLFLVVRRLFIHILLLFDQETVKVFLLILLLRRRLLFCVFDQVEMIVDSLSAIFVVLVFVGLHIVIIGALVEHGAILHILVLCHDDRPLYLFQILFGSQPQLPFSHAHLVHFHLLLLFSDIALCCLFLGKFVFLGEGFLVVLEEFLLGCTFFLDDFIIVLA